MKTTLDLPDDLMRAVKLRALQDGHELIEAVVDLLRKGLTVPAVPRPPRPAREPARITKDPATGLPLVLGDPTAPSCKMTIEEQLALYQESQLQEDLERVGLSP